MTGKERMNLALNHREGPVPIDFGASPTSGIHCSVVEQLREYYGLARHPVTIVEPFQMLGLIEEDLKQAIGIDTEHLWNPYTVFGFWNRNWKEWRTPWNQVVLVADGFETDEDPKGDVLIYPQGDRSVPPSGRMPSSSFFFDPIMRQEPFDEDELNPEDNLEEYSPMSDDVLTYLVDEAQELADSDRLVMGNLGGTALGDIALVPGPGLKHPKGIRDITEWYASTVLRRDYLHEIFSKVVEIGIANLEKVHTAVGDQVQALYICGTDFGTQTSTFCSPETFDELYAPYYKNLNDWVHANTGWKTFKHSCGAVETLMNRFIDSGFDIINPVQLSAANMDARHLKEAYGDRIVFWGGGVDTQRTLPFGTPEEVRHEVMEQCKIFSNNGGFVFNTVHNVQARTPVENFIAIIGAIDEFNGKRGN